MIFDLIIWLYLALACLNVVTGAYHGSLIKRMERETIEFGAPKTKIKHGWWGGAYLGVSAGMVWLFCHKWSLPFNWWIWIATWCIRRISFEPAVNLSRGVGINYVTPALNSLRNPWDALWKGRFVDYCLYKVFKHDNLLQYGFFLCIVVMITILIF